MIRGTIARIAALLALLMLAMPAAAQFDPAARGLAVQAKAAAKATAAALPSRNADGSIVALGDSITANATDYSVGTTLSNTWVPRGLFTMLVARSGGRLRAVDITGWPYTGSGISSTGWGELIVVSGGSGYSAGTTAASDASSRGVSGSAVSVTVTNGVVTGATVTNPGVGYLGSSPSITLTDPAGTGSGALILSQTAKAGEYAAGGIGSDQALGYIPRILNGGSPVARNVLVLIGTNDAFRGLTLAQSKANITAICQQLIAGGVRPFVVAVLPRTGVAGATGQKAAGALRRWQLTQLASVVPGTVVIDAASALIDPSLGSAAPIPAALMGDGLHPTSAGADAIGKTLWAQMSPYFSPVPLMMTTGDNGDLYDATYNPQGNLLSVAQALTSPGAIAVTGGESPWSGTRDDRIFLSRVTGGTGTGTIAASIAARSDGRAGSYQVLTVNVTGAAAGEVYRLTWSNGGSNATLDVAPAVGGSTLTEGDRVVGAVDEVVMSGVVNLKGLILRLVAANAANGYPLTPSGQYVHNGRLGTAAWGDYLEALPAWSGDSFSLQTREMVIPTGAARLTMHLDFVVNATGAASFTVKLFGASIRRLSVTGALDLPRVLANDNGSAAERLAA